jgi:hypothetical protein
VVATWSTHGLREDQARDASEGKLADFSRRFKEAFGVTPSSVLVGCRSQHIDRRIAGTSRQHGPYDGTAG